MSDELHLIPCPMCGTTPHIVKYIGGLFNLCHQPSEDKPRRYCWFGNHSSRHETPEEAIKYWNHRAATPTPAVDEAMTETVIMETTLVGFDIGTPDEIGLMFAKPETAPRIRLGSRVRLIALGQGDGKAVPHA